MTSRDFAFWLQGFFEIASPDRITYEQTEMIKRHLALVFIHEIDPSLSDDPIKQEQMNQIHHGNRPPKPSIEYEWDDMYKVWYNPSQGRPKC